MKISEDTILSAIFMICIAAVLISANVSDRHPECPQEQTR